MAAGPPCKPDNRTKNQRILVVRVEKSHTQGRVTGYSHDLRGAEAGKPQASAMKRDLESRIPFEHERSVARPFPIKRGQSSIGFPQLCSTAMLRSGSHPQDIGNRPCDCIAVVFPE